MTTGARLPRERLVEIPAGTELLRAVRYMADDDFDDITDDELENAARWLRAAAHSAREGATKLDRILRSRTTERTTPCSPSPSTRPSGEDDGTPSPSTNKPSTTAP